MGLPLSAEKRAVAREKLVDFARLVDEAIKAAGDNATPVQQGVRDYMRNVERAASDLGSRKERAVIVKRVLAGVF